MNLWIVWTKWSVIQNVLCKILQCDVTKLNDNLEFYIFLMKWWIYQCLLNCEYFEENKVGAKYSLQEMIMWCNWIEKYIKFQIILMKWWIISCYTWNGNVTNLNVDFEECWTFDHNTKFFLTWNFQLLSLQLSSAEWSWSSLVTAWWRRWLLMVFTFRVDSYSLCPFSLEIYSHFDIYPRSMHLFFCTGCLMTKLHLIWHRISYVV